MNLQQRIRKLPLDLNSLDILNKVVSKCSPSVYNEIASRVDGVEAHKQKALEQLIRSVYMTYNNPLPRYYYDFDLNRSWYNKIWPRESLRTQLESPKQSLKALVDKNGSTKVGLRFDLLENTSVDLETTSLKPKYIVPDALVSTFEFVWKHYLWLSRKKDIHKRKLGTPVATIPMDPLGCTLDSRTNSVVEKRISYVREVLWAYPPLDIENEAHVKKILLGEVPLMNLGEFWTKKRVLRSFEKAMTKTYTFHAGNYKESKLYRRNL